MHDRSATNLIITVLAFDYGTRRIGVAIGNSLTQSGQALEVISNKNHSEILLTIEGLISHWQPSMLLVGLPLFPDGTEHAMTAKAKRFGCQLESRFAKPVRYVDERYSSAVLETDAQYRHTLDSHAAALLIEQFFRESTEKSKNSSI